jgi:hypothetical protein
VQAAASAAQDPPAAGAGQPATGDHPQDEDDAGDASVTLDLATGARGPRRAARYGLRIQFEERADSLDLGRLVGSTVLVNTAHPAYLRAVASRAEGYHVALSVGMALAPLAVEPASAQAFVTAFLAVWGDALGRDKRRRQARRARPRRRLASKA